MTTSTTARARSAVRRATLVGAGAYVLWGILHLALGVSMIAGSDARTGELAAESTMFFVCAAVLGAQAIGVGLILNRRNDRFGYWLNLLTLGAVDAAFVVVMIIPGNIDLVSGLSGPALWLVGAVASTAARRYALDT